MKIVDERTKRKPVTFKDLECGDVFEYFEDIYLKLNALITGQNAYNLNSNTFTSFSDEIVNPLETELMIRGQKKYD